MTILTVFSTFYTLIALFSSANAFWQPGYSVNLSHSGTFVISEELSSDDVNDVYDDADEMIKESSLNKFDLRSDSDKYFRIHQMAMRKHAYNRDVDFDESVDNSAVKIKESIFDGEDPVPWKAGFVDKNGSYLQFVQITSKSLRSFK